MLGLAVNHLGAGEGTGGHLGLQAGQELVVTVDREGGEAATSVPNEKGLAAMREIAERQKDRPCAEGSDVVKLVREARAGAMYSYGGTE